MRTHFLLHRKQMFCDQTSSDWDQHCSLHAHVSHTRQFAQWTSHHWPLITWPPHTHTLSRVQAAHSNKKTGTFLNVFYHHDFTSVVYWRVDVYYLVFKTNNVNYQWSEPAVQKWFHHVLKEQRILNSDKITKSKLFWSGLNLSSCCLKRFSKKKKISYNKTVLFKKKKKSFFFSLLCIPPYVLYYIIFLQLKKENIKTVNS